MARDATWSSQPIGIPALDHAHRVSRGPRNMLEPAPHDKSKPTEQHAHALVDAPTELVVVSAAAGEEE